MTGRCAKNRFSVMSVILLGLCACAVFLSAIALAGEEQHGVAGLSRQKALRLGERIYRDGILPTGEPVKAIVKGDILVEGTMFTCVSCHLRSGLGSYEGSILAPATNGAKLYKPLFNIFQETASKKSAIPSFLRPSYEGQPLRPAYTDETLAAALRTGIDPTGRKLDPVMPRYLLKERDMTILIYYLKALSSESSPGVTDTAIRFATVIAGDVTKAERDAVLTPLENFVRGRNSRLETFKTRARYGPFAEPSDLAYRKMMLASWELKGPPETWRGQLEEYYRKEPVFALAGGISHGDWRPVHEFCEEHRIPCIFPITDFPVLSETDWYTLYFSKGLYQEGETVARFLQIKEALSQDKTVVQVFRDNREGHAFSEGFQNAWQDHGRRSPVNRTVGEKETVTGEFLQQLTNQEKPAILLLWLGPEAIPALETIAANGNRPEMVYLSASLLKQDLEKLPEKVRDFTYITYPYGQGKMRLPTRSAKGSNQGIERIRAKMISLSVVLTDALMMMQDDFYRDRFLEGIDMEEDKPQRFTDYERLSFGPNQRYVVKGCYIMQLSHGNSPRLIRKSDWVIH